MECLLTIPTPATLLTFRQYSLPGSFQKWADKNGSIFTMKAGPDLVARLARPASRLTEQKESNK